MTESNDEDLTDELQGSDYDGAWKDALRSHLKEFLEQCFPNLAKLIDWTREPEWLDKEISQVIARSGRRNREVDLLFKRLNWYETCIQPVILQMNFASSFV